MNKFNVAICMIIMAGLFTGCAQRANTTAKVSETQAKVSSSTQANIKKLEVYTSFYPMYDFAIKIGGDKVKVINLVPAGTEPHDWEPSTTDIANLEKADMIIYNGSGMETWTDKVIGSLTNKKLFKVEASQGIKLIQGHEEEEEHKEQKEHEESGYDPHVWISIKNAKAEMKTIKEALKVTDPNNAEYYESNFKVYADKFDQLDKEFTDTISTLPNKDIVVAHQAFGYLCADYGLNQVAIEGLSADSEPDPARMAEIVGFVKKNAVKTIFFEELVSPKVAEVIAKETGAKTDMLNPLEGLTKEQLDKGEDYIFVMEKNLVALKEALK
jgi:zinc transport system substrate-binding protein